MKRKRISSLVTRGVPYLAICLVAVLGTGCVVGQAPGRGRCVYLREAATGARYWLYLPVGYNDPPPPGQERPKRPLVMTFHGMKPFDNDNRQIREWQQEADRYGFVVCAPELFVADLFGPVPLDRKDHPSLQRDEAVTIAIMNELYRTVDVDPNKVLATSWSYGGYIAHYLVNKHPERFSCLVAKQSNFSAALLDPKNVPRYWDHKIAIFYTENDFALCKRESRQAVEWYAKHGFDLTHAVFEKKGHERTPGVAAEFFARTCGLEAKTPPVELAQMQVINIKPQDANRSPRSSQSLARQLSSMHALAPRGSGSTGSPVEVASVESPFPRTGWRSAQPGSDLPPATRDTTYGVRRFPPNAGTGTGSPRRTPPGGPIRIRLSATIGVAPLLVSYSAFIPQPLRRKAHLLWTDNGEPISNGLNGQKVFSDPGEHKLEVLVTTADGREYRVSRVISVIERPSSGSR